MTKKLLFLLALLPSFLLAQHSIKGTFTPAKEFEFVILYKVTPTTSIYVNNAEIDATGKFEFKLDSTVTKGMYRIVYAVPQNEYNFDLIYNTKEDVELTFNLEKGVTYISSQENLLLDAYSKSLQLNRENINAYYSSSNKNQNTFDSVFRVLSEAQTEFEKASDSLIASNFIKASKPYIPLEIEDAESYSKNLKTHYFKNIDFGNETLQSSGFLIETVLNYVFTFKNSADENNSYIASIDDVVEAVGENPIIKKKILEVLWHQFADPSTESVANYLADKYLFDLAKNEEALFEKLSVYKNTSIHAMAPDFTLEISKDEKVERVKLHNYDQAKQYIVVFWSSTCPHCLEELPKLQKYINTQEEGTIKVIAVGLEDNIDKWKDKTYDFYSFIHVFGEGKWDNEIGNAFGVTATPTYFILDNNKKIIAKPYDFGALKAYYQEQPIILEKEDH